jgi:hypothetical protein
MKNVVWLAGLVPLALSLGCGGGRMGSTGSSGGDGGGGTPKSAFVVISKTTTGPFSVAMSTPFQPAEWDYSFFSLNPSATTTQWICGGISYTQALGKTVSPLRLFSHGPLGLE